MVVAVICGVIFHVSGAQAQSPPFIYRPTSGTWNAQAFRFDTTLTVVAPPETSQFIRDPFGNTNPTPSSVSGAPPSLNQRMVANLRHRYRIIGNPYLRAAAVRFSWFNMNSISVAGPSGSSFDRVELQWFYGTPTSLTGNYGGSTVGLPVAASGTNSLMWPGMVFQVRTSADLPGSASSATLDRESWGFITQQLEVTGTGVMGDTIMPTLGAYDSAVSVLMTPDDVVDTLIANTGHPISVAAWQTPGFTSPGVVLWARCGAPPDAANWLRRVTPNSDGGMFFEVDVCPSGQTLHVAVTNEAVGLVRAVRMYVASRRVTQEWVGLKVGIGWNASAAELTEIRASFRRAAWQFYGLTGGTQLVRSFRFINDANQCDDGWPAEEYACEGGGCNVCLAPGSGTGNANFTGKVTLYATASDGSGPPQWLQGSNVIVHEWGHALIDHDNEYTNVGGTDRATCGHSWMGPFDDNQFTLCTAATHRQTALNWNLSRSQQGPTHIFGSTSYSHGDARSDWTKMWDDGRLAVAYPSAQTPEVLRLSPFWGSAVIGRFDRLQ